MDRDTKIKICSKFDIPTTFLSEIPLETMDRFKAIRAIILGCPPPEDSDTNLLIKTENGGRWCRLTKTITIGSGEENDLRLNDKYLSSQHCTIDNEKNVWRIRDLDSRNGVFINDHQVKEKPLTSGDIIQIGGVTLIFHVNEPR